MIANETEPSGMPKNYRLIAKKARAPVRVE